MFLIDSIVLIILFTLSSVSLADHADNPGASGYAGQIKSYFTNPPDNININNVASQLASSMLIIGYGCAVIMIFYIGIRYLIARPAEKAQLKTQLTYLIVGVIVLTSGVAMLKIVSGAFKGVFR